MNNMEILSNQQDRGRRLIMIMYVGVTDKNWYQQLSAQRPDEVNFWSPSGRSFKALQEGELFLFKLHAPDNYIVGGGYFVRFSALPPFLAWQAFGEKNGTRTYDEFCKRLQKYRGRNGIDGTYQVGCSILTEPFWFDEQDWIPVPEWSNSIVSGKRFYSGTEIGDQLYQDVIDRIPRSKHAEGINQSLFAESAGINRYAEYTTKHRLGQGAFRILVTDAYQRRCAITGEKTLPVLEAAHIKPYGQDGPHSVRNGILLKSDFHTLFDDGYLTITKDYNVEVSQRLHNDYGNGKDYYKHHGQKLLILPGQENQLPSKEYLEWHNEHVYLG